LKYLLIILLVTSSISYSQDVSVIYKADTIYFYGYDFSHAIVKTKHPINDYVFPWIVHTSKENPPSYFEEKMYLNVINDFSYTNKVNIKFIENLIGSNESRMIEEDETTGRYPLLFDNPNISSKKDKEIKEENIGAEIPNKLIEKFLSEYLLNQKTGIGLVVFVAEINKEKESTLLHFVFFDIKSRGIISVYNSHLKGASGIGMEEHWKHNFSMSVSEFLEEYNKVLYFDYRSTYKSKLKEYKNKRKRLRKLR
tara:strand:+ start:30649 stop:31407 length:759 start_codon:yes stop_codon:yes gene_type:complete